MVLNKKALGFDVMQVLYNADTVVELDDAMCVVNDGYRVLREHLETLENIKAGVKKDE